MELGGRVVVVTGGASGIGRALCQRAGEEGATVVVADRDGEAAESVAEAVGGMAVPTDVGVEREVRQLVETATDELGGIDVFVSNAGVVGGGGPEAPDDVWAHLWSVNVMAHVWAARAVLPQMLARGGGYLVSTSSAGGALTTLGNAAYTATKAAALSFAEWLSITYHDRGIRVSCICPEGVRTPMLAADLDNPAALTASRLQHDSAIEASEMAGRIIDGMRAERFLITSHPRTVEFVQRKALDHERWLASMRRQQARLERDDADTAPATG